MTHCSKTQGRQEEPPNHPQALDSEKDKTMITHCLCHNLGVVGCWVSLEIWTLCINTSNDSNFLLRWSGRWHWKRICSSPCSDLISFFGVKKAIKINKDMEDSVAQTIENGKLHFHHFFFFITSIYQTSWKHESKIFHQAFIFTYLRCNGSLLPSPCIFHNMLSSGFFFPTPLKATKSLLEYFLGKPGMRRCAISIMRHNFKVALKWQTHTFKHLV